MNKRVSHMSNVRPDRTIDDDWWHHPIPDNVKFGEGFYCETAQIFRFLRNKQPGAVISGQSCFLLCRLLFFHRR